MQLFLGTTNEKKFSELAQFFTFSAFTLARLPKEAMNEPVPEPYDTVVLNALTKARTYAERVKHTALADDTGLFIDALQGWPGVHAARIAPTAPERIAEVLARLKDVPEAERTATFRTAIAVWNPIDSTCLISEGELRGRIALAPSQGNEGFGYDPLFIPEGESRTLADISLQRKNEISHRAKAMQHMLYLLKNQWSVKHIVVGLGLVVEKGKILLHRRNDPQNKEYHGKWEFPGGGVEFGERVEETVVREVREEAGVEVSIVAPLTELSVEPVTKPSGIRYQAYLVPYLCRVERVLGPSHDEEVLESRYVSLDEVAQMELIGRNAELWQRILPELQTLVSTHSL